MRKRRTRKQWFEHHLSQARRAACSAVEQRYSPTLGKIETQISEIKARIQAAESREPFGSRFARFFGQKTDYWRTQLQSLEAELRERQETLWSLQAQQRSELEKALKRGESEYRGAFARGTALALCPFLARRR